MKITLTITDERVKPSSYAYSGGRQDYEDYTRVSLEAFEANREVIANALRAIADDIAPVKVDQSPTVHISATDARELQQAVEDAMQRQQRIAGDFR